MSSVWCVTPEAVKIDLVYVAADGSTHPFWISVKKRFTIGEERHVQTAGWKARTDAGIDIDWQARSFARTLEYLVDWSLADDAGARLDHRSREVIASLQPDVYGLIEDAITAHVVAMVDEKKATAAGRPARSLTAAS